MLYKRTFTVGLQYCTALCTPRTGLSSVYGEKVTSLQQL